MSACLGSFQTIFQSTLSPSVRKTPTVLIADNEIEGRGEIVPQCVNNSVEGG